MSDELRSQSQYWSKQAESFSRIYTRGKSRLGNLLDSLFRRDMYERFAFTMKECQPVQNRTFLDVGCGNGLYSVELAKRGATQVTGLDIAPDMLLLCEASARENAVAARCKFVLADLLSFEPPAKFDVSFGIGLFDYVRDPAPVLRRMCQTTKARVILSFPRLWTWRAPIRKLRLMARGCAVYFYTRDRIKRLLIEAGLSDHSITRIGKLYCVAAIPA
jgi:SAM-dependent methyltransferase